MSTPSQRDHRVCGFTLIELLVVISIIAMLVAFMLPVLGQARQTAWRVQCNSLHRQLLIATRQYNDDWDGVYPYYSDARLPLSRYLAYNRNAVKNSPFICPASVDKPLATWDSDPNRIYGGRFYTDGRSSYGWNSHLQGSASRYWWDRHTDPLVRVRVDRIVKPSNVWWVVDATSNRFDAWYGPSFVNGYRHGGNVPDQVPQGFNAGFVDGHASWVSWSSWLQWRADSTSQPYSWVPGYLAF